MSVNLIDTHCHIHSIGVDSADFTVKKWRDGGVDSADEVIKTAAKRGVNKLICVGTDLDDSRRAVEFVQKRDNCWATIGVHPHEAGIFLKNSKNKNDFMQFCERINPSQTERNIQKRERINPSQNLSRKIVGIGEVGLDYYREHSSKAEQVKTLEFFLDQADKTGLPVILHVRDAHTDFWPVFDNFKNIQGVLHSFSATTKELEAGLKRDLYIGLNGIMTFTKDENQLEAARAVPLNKLLLETDAPYLTPKPHRGKICKPEHVANVAEFVANLQGRTLQEVREGTTKNACELFNIT